MKQRYKGAVAQADCYNVQCPYKACGHMFQVETASKGNIVECPNCRKEMKIKWEGKVIFDKKLKQYISILSVFLILLSLPLPIYANQDIIACIIQVESCGNPHPYNKHSGAIGLMQITPIVYEEYLNQYKHSEKISLKNNKHLIYILYEPSYNISIGTWYFNKRIPQLLKHYNIKDTIENRLWAYNAGISNLVKGIKPKETRDYIKKVMKLYAQNG